MSRAAPSPFPAPVTAAVEIRALKKFRRGDGSRGGRAFADFATTSEPRVQDSIAGISGAIELLQDHEGTMSETAGAGSSPTRPPCDRLSLLLERCSSPAPTWRSRPAVPTPIDAPLRNVAAAMRNASVAIKLDIPPSLPAAAAAAELIEAVLQILVENSRQAGATEVRIEAARRSDRLVLNVRDNGGGVPPADRERIFDPFHTGQREAAPALGFRLRSLLASCGGTIVSLLWSEGCLRGGATVFGHLNRMKPPAGGSSDWHSSLDYGE